MKRLEIIKENLVISKYITREVETKEGFFCLFLVSPGADVSIPLWYD